MLHRSRPAAIGSRDSVRLEGTPACLSSDLPSSSRNASALTCRLSSRRLKASSPIQLSSPNAYASMGRSPIPNRRPGELRALARQTNDHEFAVVPAACGRRTASGVRRPMVSFARSHDGPRSARARRCMASPFGPTFGEMRRPTVRLFISILGSLLILAGAIWFLQGVGVLPGSFMSGQSQWAIYGGLALLVGITLLVLANRGRAAPPRT